MNAKFRILEGLPPYVQDVESYPSGQLLAREGLVVCFEIDGFSKWTVNFKRGNVDRPDRVFPHPDKRRLVVCAGGNIYYVDSSTRQIEREANSSVNYVEFVPDMHIMLLGDFVHFKAVGENGVLWTTEQIAWDGMRSIHIDCGVLIGEAFSSIDNLWHPFEVDLRTGNCKGGIYGAQIDRFIPIVREED